MSIGYEWIFGFFIGCGLAGGVSLWVDSIRWRRWLEENQRQKEVGHGKKY